jgi:outer membrane immunogenic protein
MKKFLISGVGLLSAIIVMGPALAADLKVEPKREREAKPQRTASQTQQTQQSSSNWSGGQAGGSNGASSVNNNFVEPGAFNYVGCGFGCTPYQTPFSFSGSPVSYIIGAFLGYRVQMGNIVVGVEGDVNWKKGESSKVQNTPPPWLVASGGVETFTGSQKQGVDGSLRGRIGVLVTPWTLLYATGGLAIGSVSGSFSYRACTDSSCPPAPSPGVGTSTNVTGSATWSDTRVGGTVGAGVETQVAPGVKVRGEYRYTDFGSFSKDVPLTTNNPGCGTSCGTNAHIDMRAYNHRFTVGLGFDL